MLADDLLQAFEPTPDDPWDAEKAAHLARRAGFGSRRSELAELVALGPEAAVARFVDFPEHDRELELEMEDIGGDLTGFVSAVGMRARTYVNRIRHWWLYRMVHGRAPLQEKLTLLWHDHFACQESKVIRGRLLLRQNELFRRYAAGSFRELLRAVARDPAMLVFLDNRLNTKERPNENWGRELVELFTLGVDRYEQADVVALARVFTGWTTPEKHIPSFRFDAEEHDTEDKQLFGERLRGRSGAQGVAEGDEAMDRVLARPECSRFIAGKLIDWFVTHEPAEAQAAALGEQLARADYDVRSALRVLFRSRWFYSAEHRFNRVKNPVEYVVGVARRLSLQNTHLAQLERFTRLLGLELFEPPSVAGWNHGDAWVNSGAVIQRYNLALDLAEMPHTTRKVLGRAAVNFSAIAANAAEDADDEELVRVLELELLERPLPDPRRRVLTDFLAGLEDDPDASPRSRRLARVRAVVHLLLTAPESAIC
jgi:uncharacterized protein (DUF1800 family)